MANSTIVGDGMATQEPHALQQCRQFLRGRYYLARGGPKAAATLSARAELQQQGASIYDVRTEGGGGQAMKQLCGQTVHYFFGQRVEGVTKSINCVDVIYGKPLTGCEVKDN